MCSRCFQPDTREPLVKSPRSSLLFTMSAHHALDHGLGRPEIAIFLPFLGGRGANRVLLLLANGFANAGRRVDLVLAECKGPLLAEVDPRVRLVDLQSGGGVLRALPAWARYMRREQPQSMLTAMDYINQAAILLRCVFARRSRLVISFHNSPTHSSAHSARWRDRHLAARTMRVLYPRADRIACVSAGVADSLADFAGLARDAIDVVWNPVVTVTFDALLTEPVEHPWMGDPNIQVVLGVGALAPQKDFSTLLRAFARLPRAVERRLVILGEGEERDLLQKLAVDLGVADRVALPGFMQNPYAWMAKVDLFVLSSRWEGFGLVVAEALAAGCPVVSTACPSGPAEILEEGRFGRLVPVGDDAEMAQAILDSLQGMPDRQALQRRGREFSVERAVTGYLKLLGFVPEMTAEIGCDTAARPCH